MIDCGLTLNEAHQVFAQKVRALADCFAEELQRSAAAHGENAQRLIAPKVLWPISLLFARQIKIVRQAQASELVIQRALLSLERLYNFEPHETKIQNELEQIVAKANPELFRRIEEARKSLLKLELAIKELQGKQLDVFQELAVVVTEQRITIGERSYVAVESDASRTRYVIPADYIPSGISLGKISLDRRDNISVSFLDETLLLQTSTNPTYSPKGIEQNLADKFHSIIINAVSSDTFYEDHITLSIVTYLKEQPHGFFIRYKDGWAHVRIKVNKLTKPREECFGDLCLIVELNYKGSLSAGVRYFEAKRRYIETGTYRAFDLKQARRIHGNTIYSSLLAYDPTMPRGWSCSDVPLVHFITPDFKPSNVVPIMAKSSRPFSQMLVHQYFRLKGSMDCREDSVKEAAMYAKQRFDRIAHCTVAIADDREEAVKLSLNFKNELEFLIENGRPLSHMRAHDEPSRGFKLGR